MARTSFARKLAALSGLTLAGLAGTAQAAPQTPDVIVLDAGVDGGNVGAHRQKRTTRRTRTMTKRLECR